MNCRIRPNTQTETTSGDLRPAIQQTTPLQLPRPRDLGRIWAASGVKRREVT